MRPPRVAILVLFFTASIFLICRSFGSFRRSSNTIATEDNPDNGSRLRSFFSFTGAFALFPPNAAISLTDDNSTFFPARPAAFGPPLPSRGLSGQLWIGSGFSDDNLQDGEAEGELGCSDVPGWDDGKAGLSLKASEKIAANAKSAVTAGKAKNSKRYDPSRRDSAADQSSTPLRSRSQPPTEAPPVDDGTDDYLQQEFQEAKRSYLDASSGSGSGHADIQSIQEAAEITGKVVLLSRGGCGFLEKVKWAQRRGAIAVIVGDNQKGGPLIQMFARGNVDNVSVPSIFTSRTTAHLLSSLVQPGSFIEDILDEHGNAVLKVQQSDKPRRRKKKKTKQGSAFVNPPPPKSTQKPKFTSPTTSKAGGSPGVGDDVLEASGQGSWLARLFRWGGGSSSAVDRNRPPSSGRLDWVMLDDWSDEKDRALKDSLDKASKAAEDKPSAPAAGNPSGDGFRIGVEDWRDPDLVGPSSSSGSADTDRSADRRLRSGADDASTGQLGKIPASTPPKDLGGSDGVINTPGSGEYHPEIVQDHPGPSPGKPSKESGPHGGIISKIFGNDDQDPPFPPDTLSRPATSNSKNPSESSDGEAHDSHDDSNNDDYDDEYDGEYHEGLWVTITPTSSASPFFDTLLVLVISPLITLTVVYALLILRAKIRRRRWRAPKSVVERLPVRTYHTVSPSPIPTPRQPSPNSSSPTTPLLQSSSRSRPRPRSRTTTGVPEQSLDTFLTVDSDRDRARPASRGEQHHEKLAAPHSSEWKKYMGRQVECVVCLEEYVDGVSRVMSLPCGHEFHAECM